MNKFENRRLRLLELVRERGAQKELAERAGIPKTYISRLTLPPGKYGARPITEVFVERLAAAAGIAPSWFDTPVGADQSLEPTTKIEGELTAANARLFLALGAFTWLEKTLTDMKKGFL